MIFIIYSNVGLIRLNNPINKEKVKKKLRDRIKKRFYMAIIQNLFLYPTMDYYRITGFICKKAL